MKHLKDVHQIANWLLSVIAVEDPQESIDPVPKAAEEIGRDLLDRGISRDYLGSDDADWMGILWYGYRNEEGRGELPSEMAHVVFELALRFAADRALERLDLGEVIEILLRFSGALSADVAVEKRKGHTTFSLSKERGEAYGVYFAVEA